MNLSVSKTLAPGTDNVTLSRPIFPYSVIPGGVRSAEELTEDIADDPVVAAHYADFVLPSTHVVRAEQAIHAYVSYRIGDTIYWTRKKLTIAKGESLITDGTNTARTRCGNRLSSVAGMPVSPNEPAEAIFNAPQLAPGPSPEIAFAAAQPKPFEPSSTTGGTPTGTTPGGSSIPVGSGGLFVPYGGSVVTGGNQVLPIPEPGALLLLSTGILGLSWLHLRRKRRA